MIHMTKTSVKCATTQTELKTKIVYFSICSRLFILLLSFISNVVIPDHNAGVYLSPLPHRNETVIDKAVEKLFGGLNRWDAQYFLHISHYGYTYENTLAFFPMFPYMTRMLAKILEFFTVSLMNSLSAILVSAILINLTLFVGAAAKLFDLTYLIFQDDKVAYIATLFFCINPASIFFSAPYSESCFSFFTFSGMLFCMRNDNLLSSFAFGLSGCVRSNGIINFGFLVHISVKDFVQFLRSKKDLYFIFSALRSILLKLVICFIVFSTPFVMFQSYAYFMFCLNKTSIPQFLNDFGVSKGFVMPDQVSPPWCNYSVPVSYSYIQSHYWNVGFLKYYRIKQIPNFLLAMPIIFFILSNSYLFMVENMKSLTSLGLNDIDFVTFCDRKIRPECFVFVFHAVCLTVFCTLFIHIQVTTRMIASSCPVLYWFAALRYNFASMTDDPIQSRLRTIGNPKKYSLIESLANVNSLWKTIVITEKPADFHSNIIRLYFISYGIIGTILFSNFYPWT